MVDIFDDNDAPLEKDKEAAEKLKKLEEPDDVEVTETDDGDIEIAPKDEVEPDDELSHKEKKQVRYREKMAMEREAGAAEARRAADEARMRLEERIRHLESRQTPDKDDLEERLSDVRSRQKALYGRYEGKKMTPEDEKDFEAEAIKLDDEKAELQAERRDRRRMANYDPRVDQLRQQVTARYPDLIANDKAGSWARFRYLQLVQAEGRPSSLETLDSAAEEARVRFNMKEPPPPTAGQKARHESGASTGGGGGTQDGRIKLSRADRDMADGVYPHIKDEKKRYAMYYKNVIVPNKKTA